MTAFHIHPHSSPKMTGPMAAYRGPKPEPGISYPSTGNHDFEYEPGSEYAERFNEWQSSLLAYIKEPGFKVGDILYQKGDKNNTKWIFQRETPQKYFVGNWLVEVSFWKYEMSHYQEGQQIDLDDFKYVKEDYLIISEESKLTGTDANVREYHKIWQEVKEPRKIIRNKRVKIGDSHNQGYNAIVEGKADMINPEWEQFQFECREGTILLEEKD